MRRRSIYKGAGCIIAVVLGLLLTSPGYAQEMHLQKAVVGSGGGTASNNTMTMQYTIGQAVVGTATNGTINGTFGFWNAAALVSGVGSETEVGGVTLAGISPNPITDGEGRIMLQIARAGEIEVALYNALGERTATLYEGTGEVGERMISFNVSNLAAGVYYVAVRVPGGIIQQPISVVK